MAEKDVWQRYLEAGIAFTNLTRAKAEEFVQELVRNGEFQRDDARARVEELLERSRASREVFVTQVRHEVDHQLEALGFHSLEDLARQVASVLQRTAEAGRASAEKVTTKVPGRKAKKPPAKKKATAKKATAKSAKKASAKKSPAKKAAAKKAAAKKPARSAKKAPGAGRPGPAA